MLPPATARDLQAELGFLTTMQQILEEDGWTQHHYQDRDTGGRCLEGALSQAVVRQTTYATDEYHYLDLVALRFRVQHRLDRIMHEEFGFLPSKHHTSTVLFNDAPSRTYEDVQLLLKKTIASVETALDAQKGTPVVQDRH